MRRLVSCSPSLSVAAALAPAAARGGAKVVTLN